MVTVLVSYVNELGIPGDIIIALREFPAADDDIDQLREIIKKDALAKGLGVIKSVVILNLVRLG